MTRIPPNGSDVTVASDTDARSDTVGRGLLEGIRVVADPSLRPGHDEVAVAVRTTDLDADEATWAVHRLDLEGDATEPPVEGRAPAWSPDGRLLAFLRRVGGFDQVWLADPTGGAPYQLTHLPAAVLQAIWLPDGSGLVLVAPTLAGPLPTGDDPVAAWRRQPIEVDRPFYKLDGIGFHRDLVTGLFIVDLDGKISSLVTGPGQVQTVAVSPSSEQIAYTATVDEPGRTDPDFVLFAVNRDGGPPTQLTRGPVGAGALAWRDEDRLIFVGQENFATDRFAHPFQIDVPSAEMTRLLPDVTDNVGGGPFGNGGPAPRILNDGRMLFTVMREGTFRLLDGDLETGKVTVLAGDETTSVLAYSQETGRLATILAGPDSAGDVHLSTLARSEVGNGPEPPPPSRVTSLQQLPATLPVSVPKPRVFQAPDGREVAGWIHLPDRAGPAPLLLDIHGGPHAAWGPTLSETTWYRHALVERGWAVLALNARGSDGYGEDFMRAATGCWGEADEGDWFAAVDALVDEGLVDPTRVAVTGYSYGGYLTCWLITRTDRFAAAVAGGAISDLHSYANTADVGGPFLLTELGAERHDDPERYRRLSPVEHAADVETPLLLLHGENDQRCPLGQAEQMYGALQRLGKDVRLVVYPDAGHALRRDGRPSHRLDYGRRVITWVERHTRPGARPTPEGQEGNAHDS